jgi:hypothetical protein
MPHIRKRKRRSRNQRKRRRKSRGVGPGDSELLPAEVLREKERQSTKDALDDPDPMSIFSISRIDEALNVTARSKEEEVHAPSIFDAWDDVDSKRMGPEAYYKSKGYSYVQPHKRNGRRVKGHPRIRRPVP